MKPLIFYPPKAHEKAITELLEAQNMQSEEKQKVSAQYISKDVKKVQVNIKTEDTPTSEEFKKHL
jgi:hypothetical protein